MVDATDGNSAGLEKVSVLDAVLNDKRSLAFMFLAPAVAILCFVVVYPFFSAIWISFQDKVAGAPGKFIGFGNYAELFSDPVFFKVIRNTLVYTIVAVGIKFLFGLTMALILNKERRFNSIFKTILFVPWAVPPIVAALNWRWIYDDFSGLLNLILIKWFGFTDVISWMGEKQFAMGAVIAVVVWTGTPFYTMSFLAGLKAIPQDLYEAARIDGASRVREFWHITIPQLRSVFAVVVMLSSIFTATNVVYVLTLTNGGPAFSTQILPNMSYNYALLAGRLGIGSAVNLVFIPILAVLIILLSKKMLEGKE